MNPVEIPRRAWSYTPRGIKGQGGYSIAEAFPIGNVPGLAAPMANPAGLAPVEHQATTADAPVQALPDILKAYVSDRSAGSFFTALRGVATAADLLVLPQPDTRRVFLLLVNIDTTNGLLVAFGSVANASNSFLIPANYGSMTFDVRVPQDDIHIVSAAASTAYQLLYSNHVEF